MGGRGWENFIERSFMKEEEKRKVKEMIDNCEENDSLLLISNGGVAIIGSIRDIVSNIMFAKLQNDVLSKIIDILKKL